MITATRFVLAEVVSQVRCALESNQIQSLEAANDQLLTALFDKSVPSNLKGSREQPGQIRRLIGEVQQKLDELHEQRKKIEQQLAAQQISTEFDCLINEAIQCRENAEKAIRTGNINVAEKNLGRISDIKVHIFWLSRFDAELEHRGGKDAVQSDFLSLTEISPNLMQRFASAKRTAQRLQGSGTRGFAPGTGIGSVPKWSSRLGKTAREKLKKKRV